MAKTNAGFILLLIAGILGILFNFMGSLITPPTSFQLNPLTISTIVISILLIVSATLIKLNKSIKIVSWISLVLSILLILSIYEWLPAILGIIGSIISLRSK